MSLASTDTVCSEETGLAGAAVELRSTSSRLSSRPSKVKKNNKNKVKNKKKNKMKKKENKSNKTTQIKANYVAGDNMRSQVPGAAHVTLHVSHAFNAC